MITNDPNDKPNPFRPSFGRVPRILVGRNDIIDSLSAALDDYLYNDAICSIIVGQRGMGKTVILNELEAMAKTKGWLVVSTSLTDSLLENIHSRLATQIDKYAKTSKKIAGFSVEILGTGFGVELAKEAPPLSWQVRMQNILEPLSEKDIGVLFLIDEIKAKHGDFCEFASAYQLFQRADLKVGLFMAGLPENVSDVLNEDVLTFLRRSNQIAIGPIDECDIAAFMFKAFAEKISLTLEEAQIISKLTKGYPYYFQLLGYNLWNISNDAYSAELLQAAIKLSSVKLNQNVLKPLFAGLGEKEKQFADAMSMLALPASSGQIEKALGVEHGAFSVYRRRLIEKQIIFSPERGLLDFVLPFSADYLKGIA